MKTARWLFSFWTRPGTRSRSRASGCQWCRQHLGAFYLWDDSLSDAELSEIERHVNACSECGKIWDEFRVNQDRIVEAALPSFDKERVLGKVLREIDSHDGSETRERQGYSLPNGWSLRFAGVCLVLLALPVLARFGLELAKNQMKEVSPEATIQSGLDSSSPTDSPTNTGRDKAVVPQLESDYAHTAIGPDDSELELLNLPGKDIERTFLLATLPQSDDQLEKWARKEFPHVMWLYDELRELDDTLSWQDLLVRSGEIYRFDWPTNPDEPCILPRLSALVRVAEAIGWQAKIVYRERGEKSPTSLLIEIPALNWTDLDESQPASANPFLQLMQSARGSKSHRPLRKDENLNRLVAMQESLDQVSEKEIDLDSYSTSLGAAGSLAPQRHTFVLTGCGIVQKEAEHPALATICSQLRETPLRANKCGRSGNTSFWRIVVGFWRESLFEERSFQKDTQHNASLYEKR